MSKGYCEQCDGTGWMRGLDSIRHQCNQCDGTGLIALKDDCETFDFRSFATDASNLEDDMSCNDWQG